MRSLLHVCIVSGCAHHPSAAQVLLVPSAPAAAMHSFGVGVRVPEGATPDLVWTSSDPRVECDVHGEVITVRFTALRDAWPYELPDFAGCVQGSLRVEVPLAFGPPFAERWFAEDGTLVVPRETNTDVMGEIAMDGLAEARVVGASGIECAKLDRGTGAVFRYRADPEATGSATCELVFDSGERREQRIAVIDY